MRHRLPAVSRLAFIAVCTLIGLSACDRSLTGQPTAATSPPAAPVVVDTVPAWTPPPVPTSPATPVEVVNDGRVEIPEVTASAQPTNPPVEVPVATEPPDYDGRVATNPEEAVAFAYGVAEPRTEAAAVALLDRQTGTLYGAGDIDETYASASVVKVFIATRLLVDGQAQDPAVRDLMWRMITLSDDDAGSRLYILAGSEGLVGWIHDRYGIDGLKPANIPNYWGLTRITARAMVTFYARVADDPAVAPWLLDAMAHVEPYGSDGYYQHFGIPPAASDWAVKQGWMCCLENLTRLHSTGYVDNDRYAVALLTAGPRAYYDQDAGATLTLMAQALMPKGAIPTAA
jgi:hypothetical protein